MRRVPPRTAMMMSLAVSIGGCAGWHTESVTPRELLEREKQVQAVRVTLRNKERVELYSPVLVADSIRGTPTERAIQRLTIPLADIQQIQSRRTSIGKTALVVLAVAGGVALYALIQELNQGY